VPEVQLPELYVQALGVYLPPDRVSSDQVAELGWYGRESPEQSLTGVHVAKDTAPADMAVLAARNALWRSGRPPADVDYLIHAPLLWQGSETWSAMGYILRELGCGHTAAQEVHQGCNGMLAALEVAAGLLALRDDGATALITTALNANSPGIDRWRSAGPGIVVGDGASAVLLGRQPGFARVDALDSVVAPEFEQVHRGREPLHDPDNATRPRFDVLARMTEFTVDSGYELRAFSAHVAGVLAETMERSMADAGVGVGDLARVIFTNVEPGMTRSLVMDPLGLPMSAGTWDFGRTVGHMGASDQIVSLDNLLVTGQLSPGDRILLVGGSPGYSVASLILTILDLPSWLDRAKEAI
jgi:3-oxoacyl-[acyl-carrier-protein] synthase III